LTRLQRRQFSEPTEQRVIPHGTIDVVELDDRVIGRMTYEAGWRWSTDVKPVAGTPSCQFHHVGVTMSGRLRVQMQDGLELEIGPGDVFEIPPGHDAWVVGDEPWVSVDFEAMRGYGRAQTDAGRRVLTSLLITDIVESTARAVAYGPAKWRELVGQHNEIGDRLINEHGGQLIKTTGDGLIGTFDSAERAVRAAVALSVALRVLGIEIRAAVHSGEVERVAGDVRGLAVHVAARMVAAGRPGDIVVSTTVHDLLDGTEYEFEDYGQHELKGLPGRRQLFRLSSASGSKTVPPAAAH
jgi:class 3 adenylate cyclase